MNNLFLILGVIIALVVVSKYQNPGDLMKSGKLNYQFIIAHAVASALLMLGIRQFAFLTEFNVIKILNENGIHETLRSTSPRDMMSLFDGLFIATVLGFHISMIISLFIMIKKKIPLINLLVVFIAAIMVLCLHFMKLELVLTMRNSIGHHYEGDWVALRFILPGLLLISLGLVAFFNPWTNKLPVRQPRFQYS